MGVVGWLQVFVGVAVAGLWAVLLLTGQVSEVEQGRIDIWFHVVAELAMAGLLVAAGASVLRGARRGGLLSALALGALGYSAVNSPGYYAEAGDWPMVAMFVGVVLAAGASFHVVWKAATVPPATAPAQRGREVDRPAAAAKAGLR